MAKKATKKEGEERRAHLEAKKADLQHRVKSIDAELKSLVK